MGKRQFGELEATILSLFKEEKSLTVKQVHQKLGGKDNYNTIMTVMYRLSQKKILGRNRVGLYYEYWLLPREEATLSFFQQIKQKIFGMGTTQLISYLIEADEKISEQELSEIEKLIQKAKIQRGMQGNDSSLNS